MDSKEPAEGLHDTKEISGQRRSRRKKDWQTGRQEHQAETESSRLTGGQVDEKAAGRQAE